MIDHTPLLRSCFEIAKDTGQPLHDVLALPLSEITLWQGYYILKNAEYEYSRKHAGKVRPEGYQD